MSVWATIAEATDLLDSGIAKLGVCGIGVYLAWLLIRREWRRQDAALKREQERVAALDKRESDRITKQDEIMTAWLKNQNDREDSRDRKMDQIIEAVKTVLHTMDLFIMTSKSVTEALREEATKSIKKEQASKEKVA